jgi:integrase
VPVLLPGAVTEARSNVGVTMEMDARNQTRTVETGRAYIRRVNALSQMAGRELGLDGEHPSPGELVGWFQGSTARWRPATIRQYRASIRYGLEKRCRKLDEYAEASAALEQLNAAPAHPEPCPPTIRRTSARKRRAASPDELQAMCTVLGWSPHPYAPLASHLLWLGVELGLRPSEWATARLEGTTLVVTNAKATNKRGNGETRSLGLDDLEPALAEMIVELVGMIETALKENSWAKIAAGVRYLFAWASAEAAKSVVSLRGARICPYSTRHIAAARAKNAMDESGVAAFLGHVSTRTATSHYARKRSARKWAPIRVTVDPAQIATVRKTYRARGAERTPSSSNRPTI